MILSVFLKVQAELLKLIEKCLEHSFKVMQLGPERAHQVLTTDDGD